MLVRQQLFVPIAPMHGHCNRFVLAWSLMWGFVALCPSPVGIQGVPTIRRMSVLPNAMSANGTDRNKRELMLLYGGLTFGWFGETPGNRIHSHPVLHHFIEIWLCHRRSLQVGGSHCPDHTNLWVPNKYVCMIRLELLDYGTCSTSD